MRRFAEIGYDAICPNLYSREAPGADPDDAAAPARAGGGVPDDRLVGDVAGAAAHLRALPHVERQGRRDRLLLAAAASRCSRPATSTWTRRSTATARSSPAPRPREWPIPITNLVDQLPNLRCPLLGLFGNEDNYPSPEQVDELDQILTEHGKEHEFHSYDDAGHALLRRRPPVLPGRGRANDGWQRIAAFYGRTCG